MKKTYQMFLALVALMLLGATNVSAEEISLQQLRVQVLSILYLMDMITIRVI